MSRDVEAPEQAGTLGFRDLQRRNRALGIELQEAMWRVLDSGQMLDGPETEAFEGEWASYTRAGHAVAVASGTDALRLTLAALGVGRGDEVIVPAFTAVPTVAAVCAVGATPVPVEVDAASAALDPAAAAAALTPQTKAAIVVHLYGRPAPVPELGVPVIEDAAHAHGALDRVSGIAACYSFYPTKNLGGIGDGGAVVTDDTGLAERVAMLRRHGRDGAGAHLHPATNSRMSELEAAALRVGLRGLDRGNRRRAEIARRYRAAAPDLGWQDDDPRHVYHLCVARPADRTAFRRRMPFETAVHYPRAVVDEPAYASLGRGRVANARAWAASCVSLPCNPELAEDEIATVCEAIAGSDRP